MEGIRRFVVRNDKVVEVSHKERFIVPRNPWPGHESTALAVLPCQKKEAEMDAAQKGVSTEFRNTGTDCIPVFDNKKHWKRYCRAYGVHAKNAGWGDPTPK